ncbi:MAG TPA: hypothetical protein VHG31_07190, partial [Stellaceae bacterium]|nr:hypothetical protein [Stellaceae bacterium]
MQEAGRRAPRGTPVLASDGLGQRFDFIYFAPFGGTFGRQIAQRVVCVAVGRTGAAQQVCLAVPVVSPSRTKAHLSSDSGSVLIGGMELFGVPLGICVTLVIVAPTIYYLDINVNLTITERLRDG